MISITSIDNYFGGTESEKSVTAFPTQCFFNERGVGAYSFSSSHQLESFRQWYTTNCLVKKSYID